MKAWSLLVVIGSLALSNLLAYLMNYPSLFFFLSNTIIIVSVLASYLYFLSRKKQIQLKIDALKKKQAPETQASVPRALPSSANTLEDLEIAKNVQQALLHYETPQLDSITIAKKCIPSNTLGGDFYTFIDKTKAHITDQTTHPGIIKYKSVEENKIGIAIGDVAGHGVSSALIMALSAGLINKIGQNHATVSETLKKANNDIKQFLTHSQVRYVTCFYCLLNLDTYELSYSKAGHPPAFVLHSDHTLDLLSSEGIFLGMYENEEFEEKTYQLRKKDRLILFTDGIYEPLVKKEDAYGLEQFKEVILKNAAKSTPLLLDAILQTTAICSETNTLKDDQTLLILEV